MEALIGQCIEDLREDDLSILIVFACTDEVFAFSDLEGKAIVLCQLTSFDRLRALELNAASRAVRIGERRLLRIAALDRTRGVLGS